MPLEGEAYSSSIGWNFQGRVGHRRQQGHQPSGVFPRESIGKDSGHCGLRHASGRYSANTVDAIA